MAKTMTWQIAYLNSRIRRYIFSATDLNRSLNTNQMHLLIYLLRHLDKQVCQKDLEIEMGLKKASITGLIDRLAAKGYIMREQAEDDRRKNYLKLTQKALDYKEEIYGKFQELDEILKKELSSEEMEMFYQISEKMEKNLNSIVKD